MENDMGMTDLQFKSFLKRLVSDLQDARDAEDKDEKDRKLDRLIEDFKSDIES